MIARIAAVALFVLLLAAAVPAWRHLREQPPPPAPTVRAAFETPPGAELGSGDEVLDAALSPDGRDIAFIATTDGVPALWRRPLADQTAVRLERTDGASQPAWSSTGEAIVFFAGGSLRRVSLADGAVRDLADAPSPAGAAWLSDGSILFSPTGRGPLVRLQDGAARDATQLRDGDTAHVSPASVGDEGDFLYVAIAEGGRRVVRLVTGGQERDLARTSGHAEVVGNVLVHVIEGTLSAQPLDETSREPRGRATPLAFGVGVSPAGRAYFAASRRVIVWAAAAPRARELVWFDLDGRRLGTLGDPADHWQVRLSPDDRRAALTTLDPLLRTLDVFVRPVEEQTASRRLSLQLSPDTDPVWSPEGARVLFRSFRGGRSDLVTRPYEISDAEDTVVVGSELEETGSDWRGTHVLFHAPGAGSGTDLWAHDIASGTRTDVVSRGFNEYDGRWSPDQRWIAYVSDEPGRPEVFVQRWPAGSPRLQATRAGGSRPRWRRDGRLLFLRDGILMQVRLEERGGALSASDAERLADLRGVRDYDAAHRTDRVLAIMPVARAQPPTAGLIVDWATSVAMPAQ